MGGNVDWNDDTKTVTINLGTNKVEMTVDRKTDYINNKAQTLEIAPVIIPWTKHCNQTKFIR